MILTVCIITKNEEKNIANAIKSVIDVAEQLVIYDTGSTDKTIQIAKDFENQFQSFKLVEGEWNDDFSLARNSALEIADGKWIYFIDADEELKTPSTLKNTIQDNDQNTDIGGILLNLTSYSETDKKNNQSTSILRIFRNHEQIRFEGRVHEQILPSIIKLNLKVINSKIQAIHHGYSVSHDELVAKNKRNIHLLELALQKDKSAYNYLQLGKSKNAIGEYKEAISCFLAALDLPISNKLTKVDIYNNAAVSYFNVDDIKNSILYAENSLELFPEQVLPYLVLADIHQTKGNIEASLSNLEKAYNSLTLNAKTTEKLLLGQINISKYDLLEKIAKLCNLSKQDNRALVLIDKAIVESSNDKRFILLKESILIENLESKSLSSIALCMIVKDEEEHLASAIESCQSIVDEIIIVDTGSKDKTVEIAKKYNAEVRYFDWIDDFASARNESIKNVSSDWILYLDADERVKKLNPFQLKQSLSKLPDSVGGVLCTLESNHSKLTGQSEIHRGGYPRIFRNLGYPNIHFKGRVHEQITPSLKEQNLSIVTSDVVIEHLGYDLSKEEMEAKVKRNYKLLLNHVKEEPLNGYAWYQLGQTLGQMNLREQSKNAIEFAISTNSLSDSVISSAYATLSHYAGSETNFSLALEYADKSLSHAQNQTYALNLKAHALAFLGRKNEAKSIFENLLNNYDESGKGIPDSGYDVVLPKNVLLKGLELCR